LNSDQKDAAQREFETLAAALQEANREARLTGDYSKLAPIAEELKAAQQRLRDLKSKLLDDDGPMSISLTALVAEKIERMFALTEQSEVRSLLEENCAANLPFIKKEGDLKPRTHSTGSSQTVGWKSFRSQAFHQHCER